jgi:hypothetical protein
MLYGFTGASRSGKTTTAQAVADDLGIEFYATSTSAVAKAHGFDAVAPMPLARRLELQHILLANHLEEIEKRSRPLIVDRTPLDFLAYAACEFHMTSHMLADQETTDLAASFYEICLDAAARYYDCIYYLSQLDTYKEEPDKPAPNKAFHRHYDFVVRGALAELSGRINMAIIHPKDFEDRREWIGEDITERLDVLDKLRTSSVYLH